MFDARLSCRPSGFYAGLQHTAYALRFTFLVNAFYEARKARYEPRLRAIPLVYNRLASLVWYAISVGREPPYDLVATGLVTHLCHFNGV